jgi:hypothetical protein
MKISMWFASARDWFDGLAPGGKVLAIIGLVLFVLFVLPLPIWLVLSLVEVGATGAADAIESVPR